jgi:hypothetical protein
MTGWSDHSRPLRSSIDETPNETSSTERRLKAQAGSPIDSLSGSSWPRAPIREDFRESRIAWSAVLTGWRPES